MSLLQEISNLKKQLEIAQKEIKTIEKLRKVAYSQRDELFKHNSVLLNERVEFKQKLQRIRGWIKKKRKELDFQEKNTARSPVSIDNDRKELNEIEELLKEKETKPKEVRK